MSGGVVGTLLVRISDTLFLLVSTLLCPAIAILIAADVFCRYLLGAPIVWAQDVTTLILAMFFFGVQPRCLRDDVHVRMTILYDRFSGLWRTAVDVLSYLSAMFLGSLLVYRLIREVTGRFSSGDTHGFLKVPLSPFRIFVATCMFLFVLEAARRLFWRIREVKR